jgi:hypothetical protein
MRLHNFLWLGAQRDGTTVSAYRRPLGYQQLTLSGTAQHLMLPTLSNGQSVGYVVIQCEGTTSSARWRDDGTAPTSTVGMILSTGVELDYSGDPTMIQFITATGSPILDISYYM